MNQPSPRRPGALAKGVEYFILFALAMYRLYLTADRDLAAGNAPHDEFWYVHKAFTGIWSGQYNEMSFVHSPVYVLWLELLNTYGVPARLGIDLAWIAAVLFLATAVRNFSKSRVACVVLAGFLLLHPYSIFVFDRSLAETLLTVTVATWLAACLEIWNSRGDGPSRRRVVMGLLAAVMFGVSYHLRKEGISLAAPLALLAGLTLFETHAWWGRRGPVRPSLGMLLFVGPMVAALAIGIGLSALNYAKWGTFARYDLANPGYVGAIAALSRIDTGRTPIHVSVTRSMLAQAYAVSPTFRQLKPQLDGPVGRYWGEPSGEIENGFFYWALRDAAGKTGWHATALLADQKYQAAADEIQSALGSGRLKKRQWLPLSFLDPDVGKWLPSLPGSFKRVARLLILPIPSDLVLPRENATAEQYGEYIRVVGRRTPLLTAAEDADFRYLADTGIADLTRLARMLGIVFICALLGGALWVLGTKKIDHAFATALVCLLFCIVRVALFAILDASAWNGSQARYIMPLLPLFGCAGALGLAVVITRVRMLSFFRPSAA